jgi:GNAT superfamily N-acetyltransferase
MRAKYYRVSRLVVLPDYQGIGVGKRLLNFIVQLYASQTKMTFYLLPINPQLIRGNIANWRITQFGNASKGKDNTRINNDIRTNLSRKSITVSLKYTPKMGSDLIQDS